MREREEFKLIHIGDCFINGANDSLFFGIYQCGIGAVINLGRIWGLHYRMERVNPKMPIKVKAEQEEKTWIMNNYTKQMSLLSDMI